MSKPVVINAKTDIEFRSEIARSALCEMHFLMDTLDREREDESQDGSCRMDHLWPLLTKRIGELNSAALNAVGDEVKTEGLANIVFGEWVMAEAS